MLTQPHYRLTYYDARGVVEPIRMIFAYKGIEYEDIRIPVTCMTEQKRAELKMEYGSLPSLEIDGVKYTQAFALLMYLAKKYDLLCEDELDNFRLFELMDHLRDYLLRWTPYFLSSTPQEQKDNLRNRLVTIENPAIMSRLNDLVLDNNTNGHPWLLGNKMTWADIALSHYIHNFKIILKDFDLIQDHPALKRLCEIVFEQHGIREWIERRPPSAF